MFGWRYCHYTSFVCMSWKTTCHDSWHPHAAYHEKLQASMNQFMSWTQQVMKKHMACSMHVMNQMSCNTCHETMIMKTHVMTWSCMETHHEQHMSWTPHEFQVLWFYHGIASAHNAKKPTQPQVPVLVLTQKLQSLSEHTCRSFKFVSLSCAVPLQCRQLHRSLVAFGR